MEADRPKGPLVRTVFVRGLPLDVKDESMNWSFGKYGPLKACRVVRDKGSGYVS